MKRIVALNRRGLRIGEDHQGAKLTNNEVELMLALRDEGWTYKELATKFEVSRSAVRKICLGLTRCQAPTRYKTVVE